MQALHDKYSKQGLAVAAFPCNQFNNQEPGSAKEIRTCLDAKPKGAGKVTWNFEKFVIDRKGNVVGRFGPRTKPDDPAIIKLIESGLADK